jgi:hypothetical protein
MWPFGLAFPMIIGAAPSVAALPQASHDEPVIHSETVPRVSYLNAPHR